MKYKYAAILLSISLGTTALFGCTRSQTSADESTAEEALYGEIKEIGDNTITIELGTQKGLPDGEDKPEMGEKPDEGDLSEKGSGTDTAENAAPEEDSDTAAGTDAAEKPEPGTGMEAPSMLELTGETKEISITEDTEITRGGMGPGGGRPDGEASDGEGTGSETPDAEMPDTGTTGSEKPDGDAPEMQEEEIAFTDLEVGDIITVTVDEDGTADSISVMSMGMDGGMDTAGVETYEAVKEYTQDTEVDGEELVSTGIDENVIHVCGGAEVTLKDMDISRTSSESTGGDTSSFYGVGAAVLNTEGITYVSGGSVETDAKGAAGLFAYGDGTVYAADTVIHTTEDTSGGIHAAGGGTFYAWNLTAETDGESSAAVRSDRGGGKMTVDGGSFTTNGTGSPAVYSTADIAVNNASLTANGSEAVCIEGVNALHLYDCSLTGNMADSSQNDCTWNVILYQSMSGDAEVGNSTFEMNGGTLSAKNGGMFYTTNTESTITLSEVAVTYAEDSEFFLRCTGNQNERGWGKSGQNGADCRFTAVSQEMQGDVIWDSISKLDFYITEGSTLTGAVTDDETCAGSGGDGYCSVYLDAASVWVVTGDSLVTSLDSAGKIVDMKGNQVTIQGTDGTVYVKGTSEYTITVETYETAGDVTGASVQTAWSVYETEKPEQLG